MRTAFPTIFQRMSQNCEQVYILYNKNKICSTRNTTLGKNYSIRLVLFIYLAVNKLLTDKMQNIFVK